MTRDLSERSIVGALIVGAFASAMILAGMALAVFAAVAEAMS